MPSPSVACSTESFLSALPRCPFAATQVLERDWRDRPTVTVEESGEILGIGRNSAYEGVNSGQIPSIRVGRRIVVPTAQLRRLLGEVA